MTSKICSSLQTSGCTGNTRSEKYYDSKNGYEVGTGVSPISGGQKISITIDSTEYELMMVRRVASAAPRVSCDSVVSKQAHILVRNSFASHSF